MTRPRPVLAIDPGPTESAFVLFDGERVEDHGKLRNDDLLSMLRCSFTASRVVVEMVACYGQPVGAEVFETCVWIGRIIEGAIASGLPEPDRMTRVQVKQHHCHTVRGINDSVLRQAMIDRFGPGKERAIGTKQAPGPLYGIKGDEWQALALAVAWWDQAVDGRTTGAKQ